MRACIYQSSAASKSPAERLERLAARLNTDLAAPQPAGRVDVVVCPELFMSGYGPDIPTAALAEPCDGPFAGKIGALCRRSGTAIVYGYPEIDGDTIYNSAACIDARGRLVANHRKMLLPPGFEQEAFSTGDELTLFTLNGMRCAMLVCYDAEHPEAARAAAEAGTQLLIVPTALSGKWQSVADQMMPTRAFENGIWLIYANHARGADDTRFLGGSCIVRPDGSDAARAGTEEELIFAEIEPQSVADAQQRLPYLGNLDRLRAITGK